MQTFLPFEDFVESAQVLDNKRLGKQRVEAMQIVKKVQERRRLRHMIYEENTLLGKRAPLYDEINAYFDREVKRIPWANHPAVVMWASEPDDWWLVNYGATMCNEWKLRGFKDTLLPFFGLQIDSMARFGRPSYRQEQHLDDMRENPPWWLGDERFHRSHRANLYRKDPEHYFGFSNDQNVTCCLPCSYWWPSHARPV